MLSGNTHLKLGLAIDEHSIRRTIEEGGEIYSIDDIREAIRQEIEDRARAMENGCDSLVCFSIEGMDESGNVGSIFEILSNQGGLIKMLADQLFPSYIHELYKRYEKAFEANVLAMHAAEPKQESLKENRESSDIDIILEAGRKCLNTEISALVAKDLLDAWDDDVDGLIKAMSHGPKKSDEISKFLIKLQQGKGEETKIAI